MELIEKPARLNLKGGCMREITFLASALIRASRLISDAHRLD
jgi:hypothetical protein